MICTGPSIARYHDPAAFCRVEVSKAPNCRLILRRACMSTSMQLH